MDDTRRYWNPGALFAERLAGYLRHPRGSRRSRVMIFLGLVLVAVPVAVGIVAFVLSMIDHLS
jgi:hypothetical protein